MVSYRHTQWATVLLAVFGSVAGVLVLLFALDPAFLPIPGMAVVVVIVAASLFCCLTVSVSHERLSLRFGIGLIKKSFSIGDVRSVEVVRNRWYYGWGIRYTPHGWLFNVSGLDAVEIALGNGRKYRIGTDEPQALLAAIRAVT